MNYGIIIEYILKLRHFYIFLRSKFIKLQHIAMYHARYINVRMFRHTLQSSVLNVNFRLKLSAYKCFIKLSYIKITVKLFKCTLYCYLYNVISNVIFPCSFNVIHTSLYICMYVCLCLCVRHNTAHESEVAGNVRVTV